MSFLVRFADVVTEVKTLDQARHVSVIAADEKKEEGKAVEAVTIPEGLPITEAAPLPETQWADPTAFSGNFSDTQSLIIKELTERRADLDARENRINQREALLRVTEKQIEEKTAELQALRSQIENLLGQQSEEEEARLQSLVKIYSGMKPKDAAAIFNDLDMDILLQVVGRMSERKSAPIIAGMDVKKAQKLTILLAEQKKLPELP
jgi:flagellar motility protein MotE (MotC chaperone)